MRSETGVWHSLIAIAERVYTRTYPGIGQRLCG